MFDTLKYVVRNMYKHSCTPANVHFGKSSDKPSMGVCVHACFVMCVCFHAWLFARLRE